jgi:hypothetical protein
MDILDEELLRFWKNLDLYKVNYIMVGGFATRFHGFNRSTDDIDVWLEDTLPNRKKLRSAFKALGYIDSPAIETMQFIPGWTNFTVGPGIELDILTSMKGLEGMTFTECLQQASIADLDGIKVPFLHINQLILNKKAVNRPKDQVDIMELEKIKKIREE